MNMILKLYINLFMKSLEISDYEAFERAVLKRNYLKATTKLSKAIMCGSRFRNTYLKGK